MIKYSAIIIWSKIPLKMKNKPCFDLLKWNTKSLYYSATRNIFCIIFIGVHKPGALI